MDTDTQSSTIRIAPLLRSLSVWEPGLLAMLADTDAGNVVTAAKSGAQWARRHVKQQNGSH